MFTFSDYYYKVEDWNSSYVYGLISRKTQRKRVPIYKIILTKYLQHKIPKQGRGVKGCWEFSRKFIQFWGGRASLRRLAYLVYVQALICFGGDSDLIQEENHFIWTQKVLIVLSTLGTTIDHHLGPNQNWSLNNRPSTPDHKGKPPCLLLVLI